jgi:methylaspartate ammonia-lyase
MARLARLLATEGLACDYYKDVAALDGDPAADGLFFIGDPITEGFSAIKERARCLSLQLVLDNGAVGRGDCLSVIRAGSHERSRPFFPEEHVSAIAAIGSRLEGVDFSSFRRVEALIGTLTIDGEELHPALRYGLSQAALEAVASTRWLTMAETLADEYDLRVGPAEVPIFGCADWHHPDVVDRLMASRADVLPQGGFTTAESIGSRGERLLDFVTSMVERLAKIGSNGYQPVFHLDVYGKLGEVFDNDVGSVADYLARMSDLIRPLKLRVEDPIGGDCAATAQQAMRRLVAAVDERELPVSIVADEHCNTADDIAEWARLAAAHMIHIKLPDLGSVANAVEAARSCRDHGVGAYVGGTMNDTEISARVTVHLALAVGAEQVMAKPGVWPDVSVAVTRNEMARTLALWELRQDLESRIDGRSVGRQWRSQ